MAKNIFHEAEKYYNVTGFKSEKEMRDFQMWSMQKLHDHLFEVGIVKDPNWLDNYLRPAFKKAFIHTVMMSEHSFLKKPNVFEIFGLDFVIDENLNLWFIESNASPVFQGTSEEKEIFQSTMLKDMFDIEYSYLRSRVKRAVKFFKDPKNKKLSKAKRVSKFRKLNKNYLEKEFEIPKNSFSKIVDLNLKGDDAFANLVKRKCFFDN